MTAIEILQAIKEGIDNSSPRPSPHQINPTYLYEKAKLLKACKPFGVLNSDTWITFGTGGGGMQGDAAETETAWAIRQLIRGMEPAAVLELATDQLSKNAVELYEISDVSGITVSEITHLEEDCWLYPNDKLPQSRYNEYAFVQRWAGGHMIKTDTAALVRKVHIEPVYVDRHDQPLIEKLSSHRAKESERRLGYRLQLRRALALQGTGPVEILSTYMAAETDHILAQDSGFSSIFSSANIFRNAQPDIAKTLSLIKQLDSFASPASLYLAIDRLARSRGDFDIVNKAIDLGMSLEVALMHDDQNAKEEINAKLGLRAGWLLGSSPETRMEARKEIGNLYSARSSATHTGRLDPAKFKHEEADALLVRLLCALLARGKFPHWNHLTFGGNGDFG